jgi:hypothetical protein
MTRDIRTIVVGEAVMPGRNPHRRSHGDDPVLEPAAELAADPGACLPPELTGRGLHEEEESRR